MKSVTNPCLSNKMVARFSRKEKKKKDTWILQINIQSKHYNPGKFPCLETPRAQSYSYFQMEKTALPPQTSCRICIPPPAATASCTVATVQLLSYLCTRETPCGSQWVFHTRYSIGACPAIIKAVIPLFPAVLQFHPCFQGLITLSQKRLHRVSFKVSTQVNTAT